MLSKQPWFRYTDDFKNELQQAREEGKDVSEYEQRIAEVLAMDDSDPRKQEMAGVIYDGIQALPTVAGYRYEEPSNLADIRAARPSGAPALKLRRIGERKLYDKLYGAWLGRCAGCLLGQPVEGWRRERLVGFFRETDNYPIRRYASSDIPEALRARYSVVDAPGAYGAGLKGWINNVRCMPEDDDTNYTVLGLKLLEKYGRDFTPEDVAECWLQNLPILHVCTAERVAYRNLVNRIYPPASAHFRNPYREWIGAQIRADFFGYCAPGNPELAAELAWRDASISHVKNGIYGEMFVAAMIATAAISSDVTEIINSGLMQIPEHSRLAERVLDVSAWKAEGLTWEQAIDRLHGIYDEANNHEWCHAISNAAIVCLALLYGELDFEKTIGIAVLAALDTDCNGATAGSILGMALGAKALPQHWIAPLNDRLRSGVDGFGLEKISGLARRTLAKAKQINL